MNYYHKITSLLPLLGATYYEEEQFLTMQQLTLHSKRLVCGNAQSMHDNVVVPSGPSWWFHTGADFTFLGLWSGLIYEIVDDRSLEALILRLLEGDPNGGPAIEIPGGEHAASHLRECEIMHLFPRTNCQRLSEVRQVKATLNLDRESALSGLGKYSPEISTDDLCNVRIGNSEMVFRLSSPFHPASSICVVLYLNGSGVATHAPALKEFVSVFGCDIYDGGWSNKILFDDPYYIPARPGIPRPRQPRNFP
jgi:hypothetical protein